MLLIDRCVFSHKFTITQFCDIFDQAQSVKNTKPLDKDNVQGERIVGREQFIFILHEIAKKLFKYEPHYMDKFFKLFLSEKIDVDEGEVNFSRVMSFDDTNRKLLTEEIILTLKDYEEELKNVYITYMC